MSLYTENEIEIEVKKHNQKLNAGLGMFSFTVGLATLGTPNPHLTAWVCLPFIIGSVISAVRYFPPTLYTLRQLKKETNAPEVIDAVKKIEKKHFSIKAILTSNFYYIYGLSFYLSIASGSPILSWLTQK